MSDQKPLEILIVEDETGIIEEDSGSIALGLSGIRPAIDWSFKDKSEWYSDDELDKYIEQAGLHKEVTYEGKPITIDFSHAPTPVHISVVATYEDALDIISKKTFDGAILDLKFPVVGRDLAQKLLDQSVAIYKDPHKTSLIKEFCEYSMDEPYYYYDDSPSRKKSLRRAVGERLADHISSSESILRDMACRDSDGLTVGPFLAHEIEKRKIPFVFWTTEIFHGLDGIMMSLAEGYLQPRGSAFSLICGAYFGEARVVDKKMVIGHKSCFGQYTGIETGYLLREKMGLK